jgi:hypothetical protein
VDAAQPAHLGVAWGLAFYQLASATADWVLWIVLADQGIFSTTTGRVLVIVSIPAGRVSRLGAVRLRWSDLRPQQGLDGAALVHGPVALGDLLKRVPPAGR